jgi:hypothetical protein
MGHDSRTGAVDLEFAAARRDGGVVRLSRGRARAMPAFEYRADGGSGLSGTRWRNRTMTIGRILYAPRY